MKVAVAVLCSIFFFTVVNCEYCLHSSAVNNAAIYNITSMPLTDVPANYSFSTCGALVDQCNQYTDCQICQWGQYCTAYHSSALYDVLPATPAYRGKTGYTMYFRGDSLYCPQGARISYVYVLFNQPTNSFTFLNENITCTYEYEAHVTGSGAFIPPIPSLNIQYQTGSSMEVQIITDPHLLNLPNLQAYYRVTLDGKNAYSGVYQSFVLSNLPSEPVYSLAVQGVYNSQASAYSATLSVNSIKGNSTEDQVIEQKIDVLGLQLQQMDQQLQGKVSNLENQISVDVVESVRNTEAQTQDIQVQIKTDDAAINARLDSIESKVNNIGGGGGSSNGGFVALGLVLGLLVGIAGTILILKFLLKVDIPMPGGGASRYGRVSTVDA